VNYTVHSRSKTRHVVAFDDGVTALVHGPWEAAMDVGRSRVASARARDAATSLLDSADKISHWADRLQVIASELLGEAMTTVKP
jgi:hypothetical protein